MKTNTNTPTNTDTDIDENLKEFETIPSDVVEKNFFNSINALNCDGFVLNMAGEESMKDEVYSEMNRNGRINDLESINNKDNYDNNDIDDGHNNDDNNNNNNNNNGGNAGNGGGRSGNWGGDGQGGDDSSGEDQSHPNPLISVALSSLGFGGILNLFNGLGNEEIQLMNVMAPNSTVLDSILLNHIASQLGCKKGVATTKKLNQFMNKINDYYRESGYIGCSLRGAHMFENGTCILEVIEPVASETPVEIVFFEKKKMPLEREEAVLDKSNSKNKKALQLRNSNTNNKLVALQEKDANNLKRVQALTKIYHDDRDKTTNEPLMIELVKGKTKTSTVVDALGISKKKVLRMDPFKLQKLQNIGPFSDLYIQPVISQKGEKSKLWIAAEEEKPYRSIEPGISISEKGLAGDLNFVDRNFLGLNQVVKFSMVTGAVKSLSQKINPNSFSIEFVDNPLKNNGNTHLRLFRDPVVKDLVREGVGANFIFPLLSKMQYSFKFGADRLKSMTTDIVSETVTSVGVNFKAVTNGGGLGGPRSTQTFDLQTISGINFQSDAFAAAMKEDQENNNNKNNNIKKSTKITGATIEGSSISPPSLFSSLKSKVSNANVKGGPFNFYLSTPQTMLSTLKNTVFDTKKTISNIAIKDVISQIRGHHLTTLHGGRLFSRVSFHTTFRQPLITFKNKYNPDPNLEESMDLVSRVNLILSSSSTPSYFCAKIPIRGYEDSDFRPFQMMTGGTTEIQVPIKLGKKADKLIGFGFVDYAMGLSDHIFRESRQKYTNPLGFEEENSSSGNLILKEGSDGDDKVHPRAENKIKRKLISKALDWTNCIQDDLEVKDYLAMGFGVRLGLFKIDMAWNAKLKPRMHFGMADLN